jgi:hypothetical protein
MRVDTGTLLQVRCRRTDSPGAEVSSDIVFSGELRVICYRVTLEVPIRLAITSLAGCPSSGSE